MSCCIGEEGEGGGMRPLGSNNSLYLEFRKLPPFLVEKYWSVGMLVRCDAGESNHETRERETVHP